jgi:hypothetical protein
MTEEKQKNKPDPWAGIMNSHGSFINDVECISELFSTIAPILDKKDKERRSRIDALTEEVRDESGKVTGRKITSRDATVISELLGHFKKLRRADFVFRHNIIVSLVTKFDEFLVEMLSVSYKQNSEWLKNPDKKISYRQLLEIKDIEDYKNDLILGEIESLMRDSHYEQVHFLDEKLKLGIESGFTGWKQFIEITERRNLFVHTGGRVSPVYLVNCKKHGVPLDPTIKEDVILGASEDYNAKGVDCFYEMAVRISQAISRRLF